MRQMVRGKRKEPKIDPRQTGHPLGASAGKLLLDLRDALHRAQRCRMALQGLGYSREQWQEIVKDVDPELRFVLRPQVFDAIIVYLESVGKPVSKDELVRALQEQAAGTPQRIRQSITLNLRCGNLLLHPGNKIGLPLRSNQEQSMARRGLRS